MSKKVENFKRRTWDTAAYERLALEREDEERSSKRVEFTTATSSNGNEDKFTIEANFAKLEYADPRAQGPAGSQKAYLDVAKRELDLDSKVGKFEKVEGSRQAGFHCPVCDLYFQDSLSLLDHVNGREHQSRLGFSMVAKRATVTDVKSKLNKHSQALLEKQLGSNLEKTAGRETFEERVKRLEAEEAAAAASSAGNGKKRASKKKAAAATPCAENEQEDVLPLGFASFGK